MPSGEQCPNVVRRSLASPEVLDHLTFPPLNREDGRIFRKDCSSPSNPLSMLTPQSNPITRPSIPLRRYDERVPSTSTSDSGQGRNLG